MEYLHVFPHLNATLNSISTLLLITGFVLIRRTMIPQHRAAMIGAASVSALFLVGYLTHHALRTYYFGLGPTRFDGQGLIRPIYFTILTSHTILAAVIGPFVILTLVRGLKGQFDKHQKLARLVFPIWLYVSVTGVVVYLILYQFYPPAAMVLPAVLIF
jgi:protein SCO1/2/putative membrane protein